MVLMVCAPSYCTTTKSSYTDKTAQNASAASATATSGGNPDEDEPESSEDEEGDLSGDEGGLHGPCNVRPPLADECKRSVT